MSTASTRTFEFKDDKSSKFWEIHQVGSTVTVRYGKTGTNGQTQEKVFDDASAASRHVAKLITDKTGKGYLEVGRAPSAGTEKSVQSDDGRAAQGVAKPPAKTKSSKSADAKPNKPKNPAQDPEATPEILLALLDKDDATNRLLAKHPRASTELLEKLSHSSDKATRQGVTGNPNTAPEIYVKLGQQFPKEFLVNPLLDLLLMINPALMEQVPEALLIRLLKQEDCPSSLLTWAAGHQQARVQLAVAMNAKAPEEAQVKLRISHHQYVQKTVSASQVSLDLTKDPLKAFELAVTDRLSVLTISELTDAWAGGDIGLTQWPYLPLAFRLQHANGGLPDWDAIMSQLVNTTWTPDVMLKLLSIDCVGLSVVRHPSTAAEVRDSVLKVFAKDSDGWKRRKVAENPSTPIPVLEILTKDKDSFVRYGVAKHPLTPVNVLQAFTKDKDDLVRSGVARNPSASDYVLSELAKDEDSIVRSSVAENPVTPVALIELLAKDKSGDVRRSIGINRFTPPTTLEVLARDADSEVRCSVLLNPAMTVSILETLANDISSDVRSKVGAHALSSGLVLKLLANDKEIEVRRSVAKNRFTPSAILEDLSKDKVFWVRDDVAENPSTSIVGLAILASDSIAMVRKSVASNTAASGDILATLANDEDGDVRCSVAGNLSTPVIALESLAKDIRWEVRRKVALNPYTPLACLRALAKDKDSGVRSCVAENTQTPSDILVKLATDKASEVVIAVAGNLNSDLSVLLQLCDSKAVEVREELAIHSHRSPKIYQKLCKDPSEDVRSALLLNHQLDQVALDDISVNIYWEKDAFSMLEHPNVSAKTAQKIADKLFATHPTESPWYCYQLSNASAQDKALVKASDVLSYSGRDPNKAVLEKRPLASLMALCAGPFIEPSRIAKVAGSIDWLVRAAVARNIGTPPNILKKLSQDAHPLVSALVAFRYADEAQGKMKNVDVESNPGTFNLTRVVGEILQRMRNDGHGWACAPLVNTKAWRDQVNIHEFLSWLKRYEVFDEVVGLFIENLDDHQKDFFWNLMTQSKDGEVRMRLVKNNPVPVEALEQFLNGDSVDVLLVIASKAAVPKELQLKAEKSAIRLITKKGSSYRQMIAKNYSYLTETIRDRMAKDRDWSVQYELRRALDLPYPEWMSNELGSCYGDDISKIEPSCPDAKVELASDFLGEVRRKQTICWLDQLRTLFKRELEIHQGAHVFSIGQITVMDVSNALTWLGCVPASDKVSPSKSARSTDWLSRLGAALHPGATQGVLDLLSSDVDPDVIQAVRSRGLILGDVSDRTTQSKA